jgi:hypothetical protein
MKCVRIVAVFGMVVQSVAAFAQAAPAQPSPTQAVAQVQAAASMAAVSLKIQVVLSRYQGDKKISSFPYTFSVTANDRSGAELRMGSQIPVVVTFSGTPTTSFKDVGTFIRCQAYSSEADRFKLDLSISDSSVYEDAAKTNASPQLGALQPLRTFSSNNTLILRDGQSSQFTTATDRITGEVTKADVTLTVIK